MAKRLPCPWPYWSEAWIELPDEWLGEHVLAYDDALAKAREAGLTLTRANFALSLALLENWEIPGMGGNPDGWQFEKIPLPLISWIITATLGDYNQCWQVPPNSLRPSENGPAAILKSNPAGSSEIQ